MIKKEFVALDRQKATRKVLDFWYRNYAKKCTLKVFSERCVGRQKEKQYVITYVGPAPLED